MSNKYIFDYDDFSFTLAIPPYWSEIYSGKPRVKLYSDYCDMLEWVKTVDNSRWILDVGVNNGIFAIPTAMLGYKVVGFEPVKNNYQSVLEAKTINGTPWLDVYKLALSNKNGDVEMYVPECFDNASLSKEAAVANMKCKQYATETVRTVTFDDWIINNPAYENIGLIKIDAQGAEYGIVEGMQKFLSTAIDIYMIVEYEDHLLKMGHTYQELDELIASLGFQQTGKIGNDKVMYKP